MELWRLAWMEREMVGACPGNDHILTCGAEIHLMNEVALHRASSPHMTMVDAFVDGKHLTQAIVSRRYAYHALIDLPSRTA